MSQEELLNLYLIATYIRAMVHNGTPKLFRSAGTPFLPQAVHLEEPGLIIQIQPPTA